MYSQKARLQAGDYEDALMVCRSLGARQSAEFAPWSVAVDHIIDTFRYLQLRPKQDCANKWALFVRTTVVDPVLNSHKQLALNASSSTRSGAAEPNIQARLLRPLLASLSNEFNDTGARFQAQAIFKVAPGLHSCIKHTLKLGFLFTFEDNFRQQSESGAAEMHLR